MYYALLFPLCGLTLLGAKFRSRSRNALGWLLVCLMFSGLVWLAACGGGSSSNSGGGGGTTRRKLHRHRHRHIGSARTDSSPGCDGTIASSRTALKNPRVESTLKL